MAHDVIAFNAMRWRLSFLACCRARGLRVTEDGDLVAGDGRRIKVIVAPSAIDVAGIRSTLEKPATRRHLERFEHERAGRWTLVRVDRVDPWKNILNGFVPVESLLTRWPELAGRIWFLALLTPARSWSAEYRRYLRECLSAARRLNERFAGPGPESPPAVTVSLARGTADDHERVFAGMRLADAVVVTSFFDGLNIVAKEAAVVSSRSPVLIVSRKCRRLRAIGGCGAPRRSLRSRRHRASHRTCLPDVRRRAGCPRSTGAGSGRGRDSGDLDRDAAGSGGHRPRRRGSQRRYPPASWTMMQISSPSVTCDTPRSPGTTSLLTATTKPLAIRPDSVST
jgi:glycosyl transferase family 20